MAEEITERVARLRSAFNLSTLDGRGETPDDIRRYYRESRLGYSLFHSREGSIHMSLSESGTYEPTGVYRVLDLLQARFPATTRQVLELGAGNGFNLKCLASRTRDISYVGIDLLREHVSKGRRILANSPNARLLLGDYQDLNFKNGRFDAIFSVESLCHARNIDAVFNGVARTLRTHGRLIVVDAWRTAAARTVSDEVQAALSLTERSMSVGSATTLPEWINRARFAGLSLVERLPLNDQVLPNLTRFENAAELALEHPQILGFASHILPPYLLLNIVAGYLMAETVRQKLHSYELIVMARSQVTAGYQPRTGGRDV